MILRFLAYLIINYWVLFIINSLLQTITLMSVISISTVKILLINIFNFELISILRFLAYLIINYWVLFIINSLLQTITLMSVISISMVLCLLILNYSLNIARLKLLIMPIHHSQVQYLIALIIIIIVVIINLWKINGQTLEASSIYSLPVFLAFLWANQTMMSGWFLYFLEIIILIFTALLSAQG